MTIIHIAATIPVSGITIPADRVEHDRHSPEKTASMTASMRERGLLQPVLIDREWTLIDGERRLRIARELGWQEIDARIAQVIAADLTDLQLLDLARDANIERAEVTALGVAEYARRRHRLLGTRSPGLTEVTRDAAAEAGISERKVRQAARVQTAATHPDPLVRAEAEDALRGLENGALTADAADGRVRDAVKDAEGRCQIPGLADLPNRGSPVTKLPTKHHDVAAVEAVLGQVVQRAAQLGAGLEGLVTAGESLASHEAVHRRAALATRNEHTVAALREVLTVSLDGLDQLRAVLAEDLDATGEGVAA